MRDLKLGEVAVGAVLGGLVALLVAVVINIGPSSPAARRGVETVYVVNHAQQFISDATIRKDIPSWEQAANRDFAPVWGTNQVRIRLVSKAPANSIEADFVNKGNVRGALAYHTVVRGSPRIVVYAGTGNYYGYSNSVSFTHELFEVLGDPTTQQMNVPWKYFPFVTVGPNTYVQPIGVAWINETCDPVEAYAYRIHGVAISDFITPNWFADQMKGGYDHMNVVQAPFTIARGGYAMFELNGQWGAITNFRHAGRDAAGFMKGERSEHVKARP